MKIRNGFVSNSSSTAFIIENETPTTKDLVDFVKSTPHILERFLGKNKEYLTVEQKEKYTQENLIKSAEENNIEFPPGEPKYCIFGSEQNTLIGEVFDHCLVLPKFDNDKLWTLLFIKTRKQMYLSEEEMILLNDLLNESIFICEPESNDEFYWRFCETLR